ncbi:alpha/beta hydrolase family protein [Thalassotalea litorea]|uniref:alpha/beta hydrolase family protein n=1 Tax=Thalassotalea litorea TaxID=2020715 RepID=UPI003735567A
MSRLSKFISTTIIGFSTMLFAAISSAAELSERQILPPAFEKASNCFSGDFSSHKSWKDMLINKNNKGENAKARVASVEKMFTAYLKEEDFNQYKSTLDCRIFWYKVGGEYVQGYYIAPKPNTADNKAKKTKPPVIVYNRGGNADFGAINFTDMFFTLFPLANEGFAIIGSQYSGFGNENSKRQDEFGGADVDDVVTLINLIPEIDGVDSEKVGMYGSSRGAMQSYLTLMQQNRVKALVAQAGDSDLIFGLQKRPEFERVYKARIPNYDTDKDNQLKKRSVLLWAEELPKQVPILLIHGDQDKRVAIEHSERLATRLTELEHPHKFIRFDGGDHSLMAHKGEVNLAVVEWFTNHL